MPALPSPGGKILRLELENFKSYKGLQTIGPFFNFTTIVGPNGSGKSNLMDAISFVLGVRTGQLRGSQLKDLIYAFDDRDKEQRGRRAFVRLVYQLPSGAELQFTRSIAGGGGSEYRIDGRVVNWDEYNSRLRSLGILVKARNFLVFQGDVESIASKNPRELTALIEQISGSDELKGDYEKLEEEKARAEEKASFLNTNRKTIVAERKQKKEQKEEAEKHLRLQDQLKTLKKDHFFWQLWNIASDMEKAQEDIADEKTSLQEASMKKKEQAKYLKEIVQCEKKIAEKNSRLDKNMAINAAAKDCGLKCLLYKVGNICTSNGMSATMKMQTEQNAKGRLRFLSRKDHYKVLEVDYDATDEKIRMNYRRLALMRHPDKHKCDKAVTAKFLQTNEAYTGNHRAIVFDKYVLQHACD